MDSYPIGIASQSLRIPDEGATFHTIPEALTFMAKNKVSFTNQQVPSVYSFYQHSSWSPTVSTGLNAKNSPHVTAASPGLTSLQISFFKEGKDNWDFVSSTPNRKYIIERWPKEENSKRDGNSIGLKRHIFIMYKQDTRRNIYTYLGQYRIVALFPITEDEAQTEGLQIALWERE